MQRDEIHTDGSFNNQTDQGGWAAVIVRAGSGQQTGGSSYEMELRAVVEAVKLAEGPCTIVSDHWGIISAAQQGKIPARCKSLWEEMYAAAADKDIQFEWHKRGQALGSRLAHQLARDAAKRR